MKIENIRFELSVIIVGAAALGTLFLHAGQLMLIASMAIGLEAGPHGLFFIPDCYALPHSDIRESGIPAG